ncbi:MAG: ATPase, T2SS/T4P/T4SS family [bacterium]
MAMPLRKDLGAILLGKGYITSEQLDEVRQVQQQTGSKDLGQVVLDLSFATERDVYECKALEIDLQFVDLDKFQFDAAVLNIVKEHIVRNNNALPVKRDGQRLFVAMSNPNNIRAIDDFQMVSGCKIVPVLAAPGAIQDAIARAYKVSDDSGGANGAGAPTNAAVVPAVASAQSDSNASLAAAAKMAMAGQSSRDGDDVEDAEAESLAQQQPIIKMANVIIQKAIEDRATDIHIEPDRRDVRVRYRVDGVLIEVMRVPKPIQAPLISRYKIMSEMNIAERRVPQDGRIGIKHEGKEYDLRVSSIPSMFGEKIVMRILDKTSVLLGMSKLGFSAETQARLEELVLQPNGMVLSTGPTGSGKTTSQYSVLHKLNSVERNIMTIEDPVEYQLSGITQVQVNKKAGLGFGNALRSFLRQDPDIIMVGEMRDLETAEIAVESSLTGHLVLSTLHTNDAPSAVIRMIDMGVEPYLISATVIGVLAQRLGRKVCQECKEHYEVRQIDLRRFGFKVVDPEAKVVLSRGRGCDNCRQTGYRGRIGFYELMTMNAEIAEMVVRRAPLADIKEAAKANGMRELREDGLLKVLEGITTPEEVMRVVFTAGYG